MSERQVIDKVPIIDRVYNVKLTEPDCLVGSKEWAVFWINSHSEFLEFIRDSHLESIIKMDFMECEKSIGNNWLCAEDIKNDETSDVIAVVKPILSDFAKHLEYLPNPVYFIDTDYQSNLVQRFTFNGLDELRQIVKNLL